MERKSFTCGAMTQDWKNFRLRTVYIVTDLINALPGNSFVNTIQNATIEEDVFSVDPTDGPID
jgi:hypothetical protein